MHTITLLSNHIESLRDEVAKLSKQNKEMAERLIEIDECYWYEGKLIWTSCGREVGGDV